eukprot:12933548-Alexandrium_andersonii.AAC.1
MNPEPRWRRSQTEREIERGREGERHMQLQTKTEACGAQRHGQEWKARSTTEQACAHDSASSEA